MSNLSNIGFPVKDEADLNILIEKIFPKLQQIDTEDGAYLLYSDKSGAQLWLQLQNNETMNVTARIRYRQALQQVTLYKFPSGLYVQFEEPQSAITEGQFVAWNIGEELVGSGVIS